MLKKVLYISYDGLTDPLGQSQVLPYLAGLCKDDFQFTVLSFEKKKRYEKEKDLVIAVAAAAGIKWVPARFNSRPPVFSKIYDRWKLRRAALKLCKKETFDIVHCRSYVAAEAGVLLKKRFHTKFLFDMRGFWADEKVDNGQWNQRRYFFRSLYRYYKKKEKQFLLNADGVITLTQAAKNYLLSKPEYRHLDIEVIPCCADLNHFDYRKVSAQEVKALKLDLKIPPGAKVITYSGSLGGWYLTDDMIAFLKVLINAHPEYVMLILTKDDPREIKNGIARAAIPPGKIFVTYANREKLPVFLALSQCGIFFIRNTFSKTASSPTKHGELMGMGLPVICNDIGDTGNILSQTKTGMLINKFDDRSFREAANGIEELEKIDPAYIRRCAMEIFDLEKGIQKYSGVYARMLK